MSAALMVASGTNTQNVGLTRYLPTSNTNLFFNLTETNADIIFETAGTWSNLYLRVTANSCSASSTLTSRKNAAAGNQTLTVGASATGEFEDTSNTDTIAAGDKLNYRFVTGAGGTSVTYTIASSLFSASSNTVSRYTAIINGTASTSTASNTTFHQVAGAFSFNATEANCQFKAKSTITYKNLFINVTANARSTTTTCGSRKNTAAGAMSVSIGASATGLFEDTSNSDSLSSGDLFNLFTTTGTGAGSITINKAGASLESTNSVFYFIDGQASEVVNASTTTNFHISGNLTQDATEANVQAQSQIACSASNLECHVSANSVLGNSPLTLRINGANGTNSISIPQSITGYFEDTAHTDTIAATDELNYQIITPAAGTSLTFNNIGIMISQSVASSTTASTLPMMGVG